MIDISQENIKQLSSETRQPFIGFARGLSMLTIVLYHIIEHVQLPSFFQKINHIGGSGIYLFFFASSYGLFFSKNTNWKKFYNKRFKKVLVPYYIGITIIFIVNQFIILYPDNWQAYLSHIFLYKMFNEKYMGSFGNHFWFISTIVQFYIVWPFLLFLSKTLEIKKLIFISFCISLLYTFIIIKLDVQFERIWYSFVIQYFWVFTLGLAVAKSNYLYKLISMNLIKYIIILVISLTICLLLNKFLGNKGNIFNDYFMFTAYFSCVVILFEVSKNYKLIDKFVMWIDSFSYSLYIVHLFVFALYLHIINTNIIKLYEVPIIVSLCIVVALFFDKLVDKITSLNLSQVKSSSVV